MDRTIATIRQHSTDELRGNWWTGAALALADEVDRLRAAMIVARRDLWWFVERGTADSWGFEETDIDEICPRAMAIQDNVLVVEPQA